MTPLLLCNKVRHCRTNKSANEKRYMSIYILITHFNELSFYDTIMHIQSTLAKFRAKINYRHLAKINSRFYGLWLMRTPTQGPDITCNNYFSGARSKGFATLRNVSKLPFFAKTGHAKAVGFRFYSVIWRSESRISSWYLEIISISWIYSLTFSRKKELLFWLLRGLTRLTCVTRQIRGDSKLRD